GAGGWIRSRGSPRGTIGPVLGWVFGSLLGSVLGSLFGGGSRRGSCGGGTLLLSRFSSAGMASGWFCVFAWCRRPQPANGSKLIVTSNVTNNRMGCSFDSCRQTTSAQCRRSKSSSPITVGYWYLNLVILLALRFRTSEFVPMVPAVPSAGNKNT